MESPRVARFGQISPPNLATLASLTLARVARLGGEICPNLAFYKGILFMPDWARFPRPLWPNLA